MDNLFYYNTAAIIHVCKDYDCFIIFKPCFKPILHSDLLSDITGTGTVILKVNVGNTWVHLNGLLTDEIDSCLIGIESRGS